MNSLNPALDVLLALRLSVQETLSGIFPWGIFKMVFSLSLLGKNWMLTQRTLFLSPKIPLLMTPIIPMGNWKRVQFLYRTVRALSQGRWSLGQCWECPCRFYHALGCREFLTVSSHAKHDPSTPFLPPGPARARMWEYFAFTPQVMLSYCICSHKSSTGPFAQKLSPGEATGSVLG